MVKRELITTQQESVTVTDLPAGKVMNMMLRMRTDAAIEILLIKAHQSLRRPAMTMIPAMSDKAMRAAKTRRTSKVRGLGAPDSDG
jgi:hypothetical protein